MSTPTEPPEGPSSVRLPEPEPEPVYDTGSDGWWRAQAQAQRVAAEHDPPPVAWTPTFEDPPLVPLAPPELVEPQVLLPEPQVLLPEPAPVRPTPAETSMTWYDDTPGQRDPYDEPPPAGPRRALLGALVAIAGVVLLIAAVLFVRHQPKTTPTAAAPTAAPTFAPTTEPTVAPTTEPTVAATTAPPAPTAPPVAPILPVTVLNNSKVHHLAERGAATFRAGGWPVPATGNYSGGTIATSTVYYAPGQRPSAERFGKQFGVRVLPRFSGLPGHGLTVVLTRDFH